MNITKLEEDVLIYGIGSTLFYISLCGKPETKKDIKSRLDACLPKNIDNPESEREIDTVEISSNCKITTVSQLSGVMSSLSKKGLVICKKEYDTKVVVITPKGLATLRKLLSYK